VPRTVDYADRGIAGSPPDRLQMLAELPLIELISSPVAGTIVARARLFVDDIVITDGDSFHGTFKNRAGLLNGERYAGLAGDTAGREYQGHRAAWLSSFGNPHVYLKNTGHQPRRGASVQNFRVEAVNACRD
jgi:hypothetical protein